MTAKNDVQDECGETGTDWWPSGSAPRFAKGTQNGLWDHPPSPLADSLRTASGGAARPASAGLGELDMLAHDLRNPLAAITLEAALVGERLATADHEAMRRGLGRIQRNAEYLARMVEDLLDFGAIDHGQLRIRNAPAELRALLDQVIDRSIAPADRGRMVLDAPVPVTVTIDAVRIERVVANLIQNALKYSPPHSQTVVSLGIVRGLARVAVTDGGPGIDPAERTSIFDKYRRGSTVTDAEGHGLGLYVSRCIVEAHGGHISVEGRRGGGSCFYFELPLG